MRLQTALILFILAVVAAFAALNWSTFTASADLSLVFSSVRMPLGLLMLGILVALTALFLAFAVNLQARALREARLHARELRAARELAERAEISRHTKLHQFLESELARQAHRSEENRTAILARNEQLERGLRTLIEQSGNTLSAYFAEYEDRLEKIAPPPANPDRKNNS